VFILESQGLRPLIGFSIKDAVSDCQLQSDLEVKREEVTADVTYPSILSTDTRNKFKSLNKRPPNRDECNVCNKAFKNGHGLSQHYSKAHGISTKCSYCDKECDGKQKLKEHLRVHTNERPYHCNICDKAFKMKQHLQNHARRIHLLT